MSVGTLYWDYKTPFYYWEFIKMIFKVVLIVVHNLFNQSRVVENMAVLFIVGAYTSVLISSHPILK